MGLQRQPLLKKLSIVNPSFKKRPLRGKGGGNVGDKRSVTHPVQY